MNKEKLCVRVCKSPNTIKREIPKHLSRIDETRDIWNKQNNKG